MRLHCWYQPATVCLKVQLTVFGAGRERRMTGMIYPKTKLTEIASNCSGAILRSSTDVAVTEAAIKR